MMNATAHLFPKKHLLLDPKSHRQSLEDHPSMAMRSAIAPASQ